MNYLVMYIICCIQTRDCVSECRAYLVYHYIHTHSHTLTHSLQSSSSQSLPAAYHSHPSSSISMTTTTSSSRPHTQHSGSTHKSFLHPSEATPLANSTLLKLSPPSLSGSTSSLNSVKSTKSAQDFTRYPKPDVTSYHQYGRSRNATSLASSGGWLKYTSGLTSTPKPKPSLTTHTAQDASTSMLYQSHLSSTSGYPSFSSYAHRLSKQQPPPGPPPVSGAGSVSIVSGSRALKRTGIASSHGSLTGILVHKWFLSVQYNVLVVCTCACMHVRKICKPISKTLFISIFSSGH